MFTREKAFNEKLLHLRDKKAQIVASVYTLEQEYYLICDMLHLDCAEPTDIIVQMDPDEYPDT